MVAFGLAHGVTTFWRGDQAVAEVGGVLCWGYLGNFRGERCSSVGFFLGLFGSSMGRESFLMWGFRRD